MDAARSLRICISWVGIGQAKKSVAVAWVNLGKRAEMNWYFPSSMAADEDSS